MSTSIPLIVLIGRESEQPPEAIRKDRFGIEKQTVKTERTVQSHQAAVSCAPFAKLDFSVDTIDDC